MKSVSRKKQNILNLNPLVELLNFFYILFLYFKVVVIKKHIKFYRLVFRPSTYVTHFLCSIISIIL